MKGNGEDTDLHMMKFCIVCQVLLQGKSRDYEFVRHTIVARSIWFGFLIIKTIRTKSGFQFQAAPKHVDFTSP